MKNLRLSLAALLAPLAVGTLSLGVLLPLEEARADLALDAAFDSDGIAEVNISVGTDAARDVAVQQDGALVLAGFSRQTTGATTIDYVALTRLDGTTGALDTAFGTDGIVSFLPGLTATNGGGGDARALAIQPTDQKIVVAGTWKASAAANRQVFVARLDTDGTLDATFGTDGVVLFTPAGITSPIAAAIGLRSDGSIIVAGTDSATDANRGFIAGLDSAGEAIAGFTDSVVPNPLTGGSGFGLNALVILPGDGILVGGGGGDLTLAQFTGTGAPDSAFGTDGIATFNFFSYDTVDGTTLTFDVITALAVLDDGRILMAGRAGASSSATATNRVLGRVTAAGALDTTFGSGGYAPFAKEGAGEVPDGLGVRPSGDIVLVGQDFKPVQVSPNGVATRVLAGAFSPLLTDLAVLTGGDLVAAGQATLSGANTALAAVRFTATDLADGPDTVPDPFAFVTQTGLETEFVATSNAVTIQGIDSPAAISISSGDQYSIGCTATFTSVAGTISNGQTVCVKTTSSANGSTDRRAFLTIGGVIGQFTVITGDATPDQFSFVDQTGVAAATQVVSEPVTLTGFAIPTGVSVTGGQYSVGCTGTWTVSPGTVSPGAQVCVRHTSSASPAGQTSTTLIVGKGTNVQDTFTSTTIGDITPDSFAFVDQVDVPKSTLIVSAPVVLTGFDSNAPVTVSGGAYSLGCTSTFTTAAGTVAPGTSVCVRHTSSSAGGTATNTVLNVGGVTDTFTSTTAGTPDTTPEPFSFTDQTGVPLATVITSGGITIGGFDTAAPISITGGTYSVNCGSQYTAASATLQPNSLICVRHTSASTGGTATNTVVTVGGVSDTFTSTTLPGDAVPAAFSFANQTGVELYADITSAPVTITGIDIASPVTVTGGEYSIGCTSTFTSARSNITNGQTVCVRHKSSFNSSEDIETVLTISTESATFTSTTRVGDQLPDDFSFTSQAGVALQTPITSNSIRIEGVDSRVGILLSGPTDNLGRPLYGVSRGCTGTLDIQDGDILEPGTTLCVLVQSASTDSTSVVVTVTIGGNGIGNLKTSTFTVTTGETVPDPFTFTDQVGVPTLTTIYADPVTITGIDAPSRVTISSNGQYQINCTGSFTALAGLVENGDTICVRHVSAASLSTQTNTVLTVGGVTDTFTTTTTADSKPLPGSSSMDAWSLLLLAPLAGYRRRRRAL
ncbi:MAG: hypothetical protein JNK40_03710 [Chromatiales bacterium]|nr:hypothetical protein [Chromatiales bacterium]